MLPKPLPAECNKASLKLFCASDAADPSDPACKSTGAKLLGGLAGAAGKVKDALFGKLRTWFANEEYGAAQFTEDFLPILGDPVAIKAKVKELAGTKIKKSELGSAGGFVSERSEWWTHGRLNLTSSCLSRSLVLTVTLIETIGKSLGGGGGGKSAPPSDDGGEPSDGSSDGGSSSSGDGDMPPPSEDGDEAPPASGDDDAPPPAPSEDDDAPPPSEDDEEAPPPPKKSKKDKKKDKKKGKGKKPPPPPPEDEEGGGEGGDGEDAPPPEDE